MMAVQQVVLDTNVVLDCFLFCDPTARFIVSALQAKRWQWLATTDMADEVIDVVDRPELERWRANRHATLAAMAELGSLIEAPLCPPAGPWSGSTPETLICGDPDDQKFIDLALACSADFLFTRDNALLRLASRARSSGTRVLRPADWPAHEATQPHMAQP